MINTITTVLFLLASTICAFYALAFPTWFQQNYKRDGNNVYQGFGLFSFRSTGAIKTPFYASITTLPYDDFWYVLENINLEESILMEADSNSNVTPNYMLGDGESFRNVLCGMSIRACQGLVATSAALSALGLCAAIVAVYFPKAGIPERIVSFVTLSASTLLAVSLVIWGWMIQQRLYNIDTITSAYTLCKADNTQWSCWFYGYGFWTCLAAIIILSIAGYVSSAGRAEKIRYFRKEFERDMANAVQASIRHDTVDQRRRIENPAPAFVRIHSGSAGSFVAQPVPPSHYKPAKASYTESNQPPYTAMTTPSNSAVEESQAQAQAQARELTTAYPTRRDEQPYSSLLKSDPNGGVV